MAVGPAYQLSPYVSLDPQQAVSANPLDFQTQLSAKYQPEGCCRLTTCPEWYFPMLDNIPLFFVMTLWSHVHTNCKITTALAANLSVLLSQCNSTCLRKRRSKSS